MRGPKGRPAHASSSPPNAATIRGCTVKRSVIGRWIDVRTRLIERAGGDPPVSAILAVSGQLAATDQKGRGGAPDDTSLDPRPSFCP